MSLASPAPPATAAPAGAAGAAADGVSFSDLGFAAFLGLLVFAQVDALGNRLFGFLPVSAYSAFYLLTGTLAVLAWVGDRGTRLTGVSTPGIRFAAALLLWALLAWTLSRHGEPGWEYMKGLAKAGALLALAAMLVDTPQRLRAAIWAMVAAGLVSALVVYAEAYSGVRLFSASEAATTAEFGGIPRSAGGSDENPTTAAHMLLVSTGLLLGLFAGVRSARMPAAAALVVCMGALALMAARSAFIGLVPALALFLLVMRKERSFPLVLLGLLALVIAAVIVSPALLDRITALADWSRDPTLVRRTTYLAVGFDLLQQSPVWGIGPGNYPTYFVGDEYRFLPGRAPVMRELHNTYLDVTVELGIVGLVLFLALLGSAFAEARRAFLGSDAVRAAGLALLLALIALAVASFFMPNKDMRYLWILLGLAFQGGRLARAGSAAQ
jgi:O-antigen ligase